MIELQFTKSILDKFAQEAVERKMYDDTLSDVSYILTKCKIIVLQYLIIFDHVLLNFLF